MNTPPIVSRQEWDSAREEMLVKEKQLTRARDALAAERRRMPMMAVEKDYEFEGPVELILPVDGQPRHASALGGQSVMRVGEFLLLHQHLLARGVPFLARNYRRCIHLSMPPQVLVGPANTDMRRARN